MKTFAIFLLLGLVGPFAFGAEKWELVWQDEFDGKIGPDWVFETGMGNDGWGNRERQFYRRENAVVKDGQLVITAKREPFQGAKYTSARLKTEGRKSWRFGRIEARIALPSFQGGWPAFWMLGDSIGKVGWPACGEIDIMEHVNAGNEIFGSAHWTAPDGSKADISRGTSRNVRNFRVYAIEWTPDFIRWFVDGTKYNELKIAGGAGGTEEFAEPFFIVLNLAIGGDWPGFEIDDRRLPAEMRVDYVRVYQDRGQPAQP